MAIKLWGNTNITLTNTSFVGDVYPGKKTVPLFTAASNWTYYFEWDLQDSGTIAVSLNINSTPKEIWTYYDSVSHHISYEFTLVTWDVVEIEVSWYWTGSNLTVTKYADEPKEIFVWEWIDDYSAIQWPAPSGFHVPLNTEWQTVYDIWKALGGWSSDWTNFWISLKLPFAGSRNYTTSNISGHGSSGNYWSSSSYNSSTVYSFSMYFRSSNIYPQSSGYRTSGYSVRCFKNVPTIPTSSWTKLYWTSIESWWIFWSSTDWLISLSSDWQTWITIADKNLWATTVWNSWDTLSEANCWKYYQWGNNYWFAWDWSVTTSLTQVNASNYWPWNYYSSDTFINHNSWRWDTTDNRNLRWWETWITKKWNVKEVYVWTTKVRPLTN